MSEQAYHYIDKHNFLGILQDIKSEHYCPALIHDPMNHDPPYPLSPRMFGAPSPILECLRSHTTLVTFSTF